MIEEANIINLRTVTSATIKLKTVSELFKN